MATYTELRSLFDDGDLVGKIEIALIIAANDLLSPPPTANDRTWISHVLANPRSEANKALKTLLADNESQTVDTIKQATDATIQAKIDAIVPELVKSLSGV